MKPEEVIELLKIQREDCTTSVLREDDIDLAIQALEKQIPKKVTFRSEYLCGNCNATINSEDCYCYNCGQRQDWSDED